MNKEITISTALTLLKILGKASLDGLTFKEKMGIVKDINTMDGVREDYRKYCEKLTEQRDQDQLKDYEVNMMATEHAGESVTVEVAGLTDAVVEKLADANPKLTGAELALLMSCCDTATD